MGRLGIAPSEAKGLTLRELESIMKHGLEHEKNNWRRFRWLATILVNISGKTMKKTVVETDLMQFEDEQKVSSLRKLLDSYGKRRNE